MADAVVSEKPKKKFNNGRKPNFKDKGQPKTVVQLTVTTPVVVDRGEDWKILKAITYETDSKKETARKFILVRNVVQESTEEGVAPESTEVSVEFDNLTSARQEVGKAISHPEKLTKSRDDVWASFKKSGK